MLSIFKKKGVPPTNTEDGIQYKLSKAEPILAYRYHKEIDVDLRFVVGTSFVSLKGLGLKGGAINEIHDIIGPPKFESSTGYTWIAVGNEGGIAFMYSIIELRGGYGIVMKIPNTPDGSFFFYR